MIDYAQQIMVIETELEEIRKLKDIFVKAQKYEKAAEQRDIEKLKENKISELKQKLNGTF